MTTTLRPHHKRAIEALIKRLCDVPRYPALIIGGSVAKGWDREDSDLDILLVTTDDEWARREPAGDIWYHDTVEGVFIDGKVLGMSFLEEIADHGSEPARAAFVGAWPGYSRIAGLPELIDRIRAYPEHERAEKLRSFWSQVALLADFFVPEAARRDDRYLLMHAVSDMVLFGCRLILAWNRILYPYHKWLTRDVERAPEKPADFLTLLQDALERPGIETAAAFRQCLAGFQDWGMSTDVIVNRFIVDSEWNWRTGVTPVYDR